MSAEPLPHRVFGELYIEDPVDHLKPEELNEYSELRYCLEELEAVNKSAPNFNYEQEFRSFRKQETALWRAEGISRREDELVPMSGNLMTARWMHHLHNPSFATTTVHNGKTADESNPCIALVMANVRGTDAVIFDHNFRRELVDPFIKYPKNILDCHEQHLSVIRQHATAPVEVIYGRLVRRRVLQTLNITRLKLWGSYKGCEIFLEWKTHDGGNPGQKLRRLILFVYHPQYFLQPWGRQMALQQDRSLSIASKLAKVQIRADFYRAGWENTIKLLPYAIYLENLNFAKAATAAILALKKKAQQTISSEQAFLETHSSQDSIPHISKSALTPGESNSAGIENARQAVNRMNDNNSFILRIHTHAWESVVRSLGEATELPQTIVCMCINCQEEGKIGPKRSAFAIDSRPRWTQGVPAKYIERTSECWTCEIQRRMVPADRNIESITPLQMANFWKECSSLAKGEQIKLLQDIREATKIHRTQKIGKKFNRQPRDYKRKCSFGDQIERDKNRPVAEAKCSRCQRLAADDTDAQWEKVTGRYIAMTKQTCSSSQCKKRARLFIPRDSSVEYISYHALEMRRHRAE